MQTQSTLSAAERKAISLYMARRKRAWVSPARRTFPRFYEGMTTADYIVAYYATNHAPTEYSMRDGYRPNRQAAEGLARQLFDLGPLERRAPTYAGAEVVEESLP